MRILIEGVDSDAPTDDEHAIGGNGKTPTAGPSNRKINGLLSCEKLTWHTKTCPGLNRRSYGKGHYRDTEVQNQLGISVRLILRIVNYLAH